MYNKRLVLLIKTELHAWQPLFRWKMLNKDWSKINWFDVYFQLLIDQLLSMIETLIAADNTTIWWIINCLFKVLILNGFFMDFFDNLLSLPLFRTSLNSKSMDWDGLFSVWRMISTRKRRCYVPLVFRLVCVERYFKSFV